MWRGQGGDRRGGRKQALPQVRGGRVSKRGRNGGTNSALGRLTRIIGVDDAIPSGSGIVGGLSSPSAEHNMTTPSTSRASVCLAPHPSSTTSATEQLPDRKATIDAAKAHLLSTAGVVAVPPIYNRAITSRNLLRIKGDLMQLYKDPPSGIHVMQDDNDMTLIHVIITGPNDTPYEGGFFYFLVTCDAEYPIQPPNVKFMTTGGGKIRFNPNLYPNGRVCLSVLGTWPGPRWTPLQTLSSLLIQIQSHIFNEQPYFNEPGLIKELRKGDLIRYREYLQHETIRVAVIGMVNNDFHLRIPEELIDHIKRSFLAMYDIYEATLISNLRLSGRTIIIPQERNKKVKFQHDNLLKRLRDLKMKLSPNVEDSTSMPSCSGEPSNIDDKIMNVE